MQSSAFAARRSENKPQLRPRAVLLLCAILLSGVPVGWSTRLAVSRYRDRSLTVDPHTLDIGHVWMTDDLRHRVTVRNSG